MHSLFGTARDRTWDLSIPSRTFYHYSTATPNVTNSSHVSPTTPWTTSLLWVELDFLRKKLFHFVWHPFFIWRHFKQSFCSRWLRKQWRHGLQGRSTKFEGPALFSKTVESRLQGIKNFVLILCRKRHFILDCVGNDGRHGFKWSVYKEYINYAKIAIN